MPEGLTDGLSAVALVMSGERNGTTGRDIDPEGIDHPIHYNVHPSGTECIDVVEHFGFNVGNAVKYLWRADEKHDALEDLRKAAWYVNREIERRTRGAQGH